MKRISKSKAVTRTLMMVVFLIVPIFSNAQGLFGYGPISHEETENESLFTVWEGAGMEWNNGGMIPQDPTQEAPLGSGILVLIASGAGYTIAKTKSRKEEQQ